MTVRKKFVDFVSSKTPVQRGSIIKVSGSSIFVSSTSGLKEFRVTTPGVYKVGSKVRFQGNTLMGVIPADIEGAVHVV